MKLKRLLLCLAVDASETSDEIQGRGFGIGNHDHVHTTQQVPITHATAASSYNYQTCLQMGGTWYNVVDNPYCSLPTVAPTEAPTAAPTAAPTHGSLSNMEQAKLDCIQGGHYWITDPQGGGFHFCSWTAPGATQAPTAAPTLAQTHIFHSASSFNNQNDCENHGFYWYQFPTYGYCDDEKVESVAFAFQNPQLDCMEKNGRWIAALQSCELACSQCEGVCGTDLVCVCGKGQYGQNCEFCSSGYFKSDGHGCIEDPNSIRDCESSYCNNHGHCQENGGVKTCTCFNGFKGDQCQDTITINPCEIVNHCNGGGVCSLKFVNGKQVPSCKCYSGFTGTFCKKKVQVDPCQQLNYCNNGHCIIDRHTLVASCSCNEGWRGDTCLVKATVSCADLDYCNHGGNQGSCYPSRTGGDSICKCNGRFYGNKCQYEKQDSRCADQSFCSNGGVCKESATTKYCECPDSYEGDFCQYPPGTPKCDYTDCNNGVCSHDNDGYPVCTCQNGWKGPYCNVAIPCTRDCPFGRCAHGQNSQYCADCPENFFGRECKYDCSSCADGEICEKTFEGDNVVSAKCVVKPVSVCEASQNICLNGCSCVDKVKDGYFFTCQNQLGKNFLGKRCQWAEPVLECAKDLIKIKITNAFHEKFSFSSKTYSIGSYSKTVDTGNTETQLVIRQSENPDVFRTRVVDGSLVMSSDVVLRLARDNNPSFSSQMRVMTFACKYSIDKETSEVFNPTHWPSETLVENNKNFNVDLKFFSVSAAFEAHRRARESAFVLHGEDVYVSASIHDSVDNLPSSVKLLFQNCDLRQGNTFIPVISNGCPVYDTSGQRNFAEVTFATQQPTNGVEFKMTVLGFQANSDALKLTCEVSFCDESQGTCNANANCNGRRKRAISSPTITLEVAPIFILSPGAFQKSEIHLS